jgi:serine/threonine protein kinase
MLAAMLVCPECGESYEVGPTCSRDGARLSNTSDEPLLGQWVGSYRIAARIGAGGMGQVFRAVQPAIGSRVAIKVLSSDWSEHSTLVERFFMEARSANLIRHESIVSVLDLARLPDGRPYIVMEYLDGQSLAQLIGDRGRLPLGAAVRLLGEVCQGLAAAHDHGIVHRDLKPDNLWITPAGRAKILDFGIAKLAVEQAAKGPPLTATGAILGTPSYMAPEQAFGGTIDARTDIYALGVVLFEACTGRVPFVGTTLFEVLKKHVDQPPPAPQTLRPDLPGPLVAVILRALQKDPVRRFQTARELGQALAETEPWVGAESLVPLLAAARSALPREPSSPSMAGRADMHPAETGAVWPAGSLPGHSVYGAAEGSYVGTGWDARSVVSPAITAYRARPPSASSGLLVVALLGALAVVGVGLVGVAAWGLVHVLGSRSDASGRTPVARQAEGGASRTGDSPAKSLPAAKKPARWLSRSVKFVRVSGGELPDVVGQAILKNGTELAVVNGATGKVIWHRPLVDPNGEEYADGRDGILFASGSNALVRYDARNGAERWKIQLGSRPYDVTFASGCASILLGNLKEPVGVALLGGAAQACPGAPAGQYPSLRLAAKDAHFVHGAWTVDGSVLRDSKPINPDPPRIVVRITQAGRELGRQSLPIEPIVNIRGQHALVADTDAGAFVFGRTQAGKAAWGLVELPGGRIVHSQVGTGKVDPEQGTPAAVGARNMVYVLHDGILEAYDAPTGRLVWTAGED